MTATARSAPSRRVLASVAPPLDSAPTLTPSRPAESLTAPIEHLDFEAACTFAELDDLAPCGTAPITHHLIAPQACGHGEVLCEAHASRWSVWIAVAISEPGCWETTCEHCGADWPTESYRVVAL